MRGLNKSSLIINDSLHLENYICNFYSTEVNEVDFDDFEKLLSLKNALSDLNLPLNVENGENLYTIALYDKHLSRMHHLDESKIIDFANKMGKETCLVPSISIKEGYSFGNTWNYYYVVYLHIFIVKKEKIFYRQGRGLLKDIHLPYEKHELPSIDIIEYRKKLEPTQEEWNELVRRAMRPYLKRLK